MTTPRPLTPNFHPFSLDRIESIRRAREAALDELQRKLLLRSNRKRSAMDNAQLLLFRKERE